jgi:hypothetical protein
MDNHELVSKGFRSLRDALSVFISNELSSTQGQDWWNKAVISILRDDQKRGLPLSGDFDALAGSLDIANCLALFGIHWNTILKRKLSPDHRSWASELVGVRNKLAHLAGGDFSDDNTWRALDTMQRLADQIDGDCAMKIRDLLRTARYGTPDGSASLASAPTPAPAKGKTGTTIGVLDASPHGGLPAWRDVISPHPDVSQGRYKNAEFAADLAQVHRNKGALEYCDPVEFFSRTFVTEGMAGLLKQSLLRVCGQGGDPVIQLKTAFGGGKTHSLLALYHLMRGQASLSNIPTVKSILAGAGVDALPPVNVAVLVGTAINPATSRRPPNLPGATINTLWGEMAAQLAISAGNHALYDLVKESDKMGVSPGSESLTLLLNSAGHCLVLMDELVAYARKLHGQDKLPAGTFGNLITFIQEITEAARASKNSLVVATIPESDIETGGEAGKIALDAIEHTFGRMVSIWKPVAANEGYEVVRRRLFLNCKNEGERDAVCSAFSAMYNENNSDFPIEAKEVVYKERMASCYPIHPEVFDRLYSDWSTLERFQRTRGVLRLMASVVHELWIHDDRSLMIMPGSIPLDAPNVRDELTRHLDETWNSIVDKEVDGKNSGPFNLDKENSRYGNKLASRRVARTIMLGSAPTVRGQTARGIESSRIRLGVVQPGENISVFNDALNSLSNSLSYLYSNQPGGLYWYDNRPTLRKTAEDRASQIDKADVEREIESRLRQLKSCPPFGGIHVCPGNSLDVPDDQAVRLVVLRPSDVFDNKASGNPAIDAINGILNNRGNNPRIFRNMLVFVAPDHIPMPSLRQTARDYLAWKTIERDKDTLNLDAVQNRETKDRLFGLTRTLDDQIRLAYCQLVVPHIDRDEDISAMILNEAKMLIGQEGIVAGTAHKLEQGGDIATNLGPMVLKTKLDDLFWKDAECIPISKLWENFCTYCYLPRLAKYSVLENSILEGIKSVEFFAYAAGHENGRYVDLNIGRQTSSIDKSGLLVRADVALRQLEDEKAKREPGTGGSTEKADILGGGFAADSEADNQTALGGTSDSAAPTSTGTHSSGHEPARPITRFHLSSSLDPTRIGRDVRDLAENIINHLVNADGSEVTVSLEVTAEAPKGLSQEVVRVVTENCKALRQEDFELD